jgi:hypothetical protein
MILVVVRFALGREAFRRFSFESQPALGDFRARFRGEGWALQAVQADEATYSALVSLNATSSAAIGSLIGGLQEFPGRFVELHLTERAAGQPPAATELAWRHQLAFPAEGRRCPDCGVGEPPHMLWCPRYSESDQPLRP